MARKKHKLILRQSNNREALYFNKIKLSDKEKLESEDYLKSLSKIIELNLDYKIEIFVGDENNNSKISTFFDREIK